MNKIKQIILKEVKLQLFELAMLELPVYQRALKFADFIHREQSRKSTGDKYINHPIAVSMILSQWGYNTWYQSVAILHDVIEDAKNVSVASNLIKKYFGNKIYDTIELLSHTPNIEYNEYLLQLAKKDKSAFIIKMADMWSNLNDNASKKQLLKYSNAIKFLLDNDIKDIPQRLITLSKKILNYN